MHLYDKYKKLNSVEHFLKHSSFGDRLILLFAWSYISYVAEQKKSLKELLSLTAARTSTAGENFTKIKEKQNRFYELRLTRTRMV